MAFKNGVVTTSGVAAPAAAANDAVAGDWSRNSTPHQACAAGGRREAPAPEGAAPARAARPSGPSAVSAPQAGAGYTSHALAPQARPSLRSTARLRRRLVRACVLCRGWSWLRRCRRGLPVPLSLAGIDRAARSLCPGPTRTRPGPFHLGHLCPSPLRARRGGPWPATSPSCPPPPTSARSVSRRLRQPPRRPLEHILARRLLCQRCVARGGERESANAAWGVTKARLRGAWDARRVAGRCPGRAVFSALATCALSIEPHHTRGRRRRAGDVLVCFKWFCYT